MSIFYGRTKVSGNGSEGSGSGEGALGSYVVRDTTQFTEGQSILSWATTITASTEKSIYENIPSDAPTKDFTGVISAKILSPENKIREVIAYGTSTDEIYYRIAISGSTSMWLSPWRNIVSDATTLSGMTVNEIFNVNKELRDYISISGGHTDLRLLIGMNMVPPGEYILDMSTSFAKSLTGVPESAGVIHLTITRVVHDDMYNATVLAVTEETNPSTYICSIYNTLSYTNWMSIGGTSGVSDTLGIAFRTPIRSTSDFNQITEDGAYYVANESIMATLYNRPCDDCGYLNVRHTSHYDIIQEYVTDTFRIWSRRYKAGVGWSDWVYIYNSSDDLTKNAPNGVHIGASAPELTTMLWVDTGNSAALKYYDPSAKAWLACSLAWS